MTVNREAFLTAGSPRGARAEELIVTVYRCAMAGFSSGEIDAWDIGWRTLGAAVPDAEAGPLFGHFHGFARALLAVSQRPLAWRPAACAGLCDDEALAMTMIATAQRADIAGTLSAAARLLGVDGLGDALQAAQSLGSALARHGLVIGGPGETWTCDFDLCPLRKLN